MVESWLVLGKGRIRASTEKLSGRVPKNGQLPVSTEKWYNLDEYQKMVESGRVPESGRIRATTRKR